MVTWPTRCLWESLRRESPLLQFPGPGIQKHIVFRSEVVGVSVKNVCPVQRACCPHKVASNPQTWIHPTFFGARFCEASGGHDRPQNRIRTLNWLDIHRVHLRTAGNSWKRAKHDLIAMPQKPIAESRYQRNHQDLMKTLETSRML
ncbi:Hypothetical predicted protein [Podarcis lilfordi]|uniref:Uncharacterized protein n=1 Tax=Podarcis lilfordi TaxID=74358 RepID=A0AA35L2R4_9SAUR|nr:Hypothetical predicted protein [Podarcis lilfordi]